MAAAERAETAAFHAHVGEIDVAVDHVRDAIAHSAAPQFVGRGKQPVEDSPSALKRASRRLQPKVRGLPATLSRTVMRPPASRRTNPASSVQASAAWRRWLRPSNSESRRYSGYVGQPLAQLEPGFAASRDRSAAICGPRHLGIDEIARHRRDAAPIVDARKQVESIRIARKIGRHLQVHRARPGSAGPPPRFARHPAPSARGAAQTACPASRENSERSLPECARTSHSVHESQTAHPLVRRASRRCQSECPW